MLKEMASSWIHMGKFSCSRVLYRYPRETERQRDRKPDRPTDRLKGIVFDDDDDDDASYVAGAATEAGCTRQLGVYVYVCMYVLTPL